MNAESVPRISLDEAKRRWERDKSLVFVDTRAPAAWDASDAKLPGAIRVPPGEAERRLAELPRGRPVVTYCT